MKRKRLIPLVCVGAIILSALAACDFYKNPIETEEQRMIKHNAEIFRQTLIENVTEYRIVALSDLTSFKWDRVLFFEGYTSAEAMYEAVGYRWDEIRFEVGKLETDLVFMYEDKVVCHLTEHYSIDMIDNRPYTIRIGIRSEKSELLKEDSPKFLVTDLRRRESTNGTSLNLSLNWFDDTLVDIDKSRSYSEAISGQWNGHDGVTRVTLDFVLTKEGLVRGFIRHTRPADDGIGFGSDVYAQFMGVLHDNIAQCTVFSIHSNRDYENSYDGQQPLVFDLTYSEENHQFHLVIDFSDKMQVRHIDGGAFDIDGKVTAKTSIPHLTTPLK
jgi:hypothetical protein